MVVSVYVDSKIFYSCCSKRSKDLLNFLANDRPESSNYQTYYSHWKMIGTYNEHDYIHIINAPVKHVSMHICTYCVRVCMSRILRSHFTHFQGNTKLWCYPDFWQGIEHEHGMSSIMNCRNGLLCWLVFTTMNWRDKTV